MKPSLQLPQELTSYQAGSAFILATAFVIAILQMWKWRLWDITWLRQQVWRPRLWDLVTVGRLLPLPELLAAELQVPRCTSDGAVFSSIIPLYRHTFLGSSHHQPRLTIDERARVLREGMYTDVQTGKCKSCSPLVRMSCNLSWVKDKNVGEPGTEIVLNKV